MKRNGEGLGTSISEMLDTEYRGVSLYTVCDDAISDCDFVDRVSVVVDKSNLSPTIWRAAKTQKTISPAANGTPTYAD